MEKNSPDDKDGEGVAYPILQDKADREKYCFATPMHALLEVYPPFAGGIRMKWRRENGQLGLEPFAQF